METGERTSKGFSDKAKLFQQRAFQALPLLIRQAKAGSTIYYSDLAPQLGMSNPRSLGAVLGVVGNEMKILGALWKVEIPPIQCLVVNKSHGLPGDGIGHFIDPKNFRKKTSSEKRRLVDQKISEVRDYAGWDAVLEHYGMQPAILITPADLIREAETIKAKFNGVGEGKEHRALKQYISENPSLFGLPRDCVSILEYTFDSCDTIDVLFQNGSEWVGVEVKGPVSDDADIIRGMFQCAKYLALMEATQKLLQTGLNSRVVLAIGRDFPKSLDARRVTLQTEVQRVLLR
ncbi:hypothetical protein SAMN05421770_10339 [Granulicella rosea]|uniref:DUF91 domain-containing protein n=1 Tax=Granulicella rosea TaxID=474952 RepID=A0A239ICN5_9BACT|nr:hypothetical protein [Granulicella rosea]SNS91028.1 hypothetical protein SAMN05421770_10339 [Granulicella rosea]